MIVDALKQTDLQFYKCIEQGDCTLLHLSRRLIFFDLFAFSSAVTRTPRWEKWSPPDKGAQV